MKCSYCGEDVIDTDDYERVSVMTVVDGQLVSEPGKQHRECLVSTTVGHVFGYCSCTGYEPTRATGRLVMEAIAEKGWWA